MDFYGVDRSFELLQKESRNSKSDASEHRYSMISDLLEMLKNCGYIINIYCEKCECYAEVNCLFTRDICSKYVTIKPSSTG